MPGLGPDWGMVSVQPASRDFAEAETPGSMGHIQRLRPRLANVFSVKGQTVNTLGPAGRRFYQTPCSVVKVGQQPRPSASYEYFNKTPLMDTLTFGCHILFYMP